MPVTTLRAGIIVGHGGISWEITRQLVEHLPAMITPRWVRTRTQPIAAADVIRYLVGVLQVPEAAGRVFEIGGPEVLAYVDMLRRVAALEGRRTPIVPVPLLSPSLSSLWLALVTDVDVRTGRSLIDSMINEVVVRDDSIRELVQLRADGFRRCRTGRTRRTRPSAAPMTRRHATTGLLPRWLVEKVPRDHRESDAAFAHRRRVVAGVSVAGAGLLGVSLSSEPDSPRFYVLTLGVASTWLVGGLRSGPLHLGRVRVGEHTYRRPVITPVVTGVAAFGAFYAAALVVRRIPLLDEAITSVLRYATRGTGPLVLTTALANAVAEEVFFRGALYAALTERRAVPVSTAVYVTATAATRNPALVLASAVMGTLFAAQRRASGGVQAPILTHLTWSALMLRYLPPLFREPRPARAGSTG